MITMSNGNPKSSSETPIGPAVSPLSSGVVARLLWASGLASLLWIAAAWAMGWLS